MNKGFQNENNCQSRARTELFQAMSNQDAIITLAVIGNVLNLAYNVPLVWRVMRLWDAENLSAYFLSMRITGSIIWLLYAVLAVDTWVGVSYTVTLISSGLLTLVKLCPRKNQSVEAVRQITEV